MYPAATCRRDLQYTVKVLAGHLQHPSAEHVAVALRAVDYLAASQFSGTCDASFMTGPSMKGVTGWSFHKQGAAVAWKATNQVIVSLSSTEAELIAVDEATREL